MRVRVNFGARMFLYAEGSKHRAAADMWSDSMEDLRQAFEELPFALEADVMNDSVMDGQVVSKPSTAKPAPLTIPKDAGKGACTQLHCKGLVKVAHVSVCGNKCIAV